MEIFYIELLGNRNVDHISENYLDRPLLVIHPFHTETSMGKCYIWHKILRRLIATINLEVQGLIPLTMSAGILLFELLARGFLVDIQVRKFISYIQSIQVVCMLKISKQSNGVTRKRIDG